MDEETLRTMARQYREAFSSYEKFCPLYASKALMTKAIAKIMDSEGFGFDVVSGGELYTVLSVGVNPKKILFNGSNKSIEELEMAVDNGIGHISVDNFLELALLDNVLKSKNKTQHSGALMGVKPPTAPIGHRSEN